MHLTKLIAAWALASLTAAQDEPIAPLPLAATLASTPELSTLALLMLGIDIVEPVGNRPNTTILAPSNEALAMFEQTPVYDRIAEDGSYLAAILLYHILPDRYPAADIPSAGGVFARTFLQNTTYENVSGQVVHAVSSDDFVRLFSANQMNATVITKDIEYDNGIIHIIDSVLIPPYNVSRTASNLGLSALYGALEQTNQVETIDTTPNVTVFAPNNAAFERLMGETEDNDESALTKILQRHVVGGTVAYSTLLNDGSTLTTLDGINLTVRAQEGEVFVNNARVIMPDILVANGVVHVIDNVLDSDAVATDVPTATATPTTRGPTQEPTRVETTVSPSTGAAMSLRTGSVAAAAVIGAAALAVMEGGLA